MKALINVRLYDYVNFIDNGFIIFDRLVIAAGAMADFERERERHRPVELMDGCGRLLLPGLINFHTHVYSTLARGFDFQRSPDSFKALLEGVWWRLDHFLSLEDLRISTRIFGIESLKKGVVGIIDHHAGAAVAGSTAVVEDGLQALGMHGLSCFETSDRFDLEEALAENLAMMGRTNGPFGLHASMSLADDTLKRVGDEIGAHPVHVHVSESLEDHRAYACSPVMRLHRHGLISPDSLLAHCVHIDRDDARIIWKQKAIVVINARSNLNNAVGVINYPLLKGTGVPLTVGTDGLGSDVARSWQDLLFLGKASTGHMGGMSIGELQNYITGSYGLYERIAGRKLGRFAAGHFFDAFTVNYEPVTPMNQANAFAHVFFAVFDQICAENVWVGGELCLSSGRATRGSEKLSPEEKDCVKRLWRRMEDNDGYNG